MPLHVCVPTFNHRRVRAINPAIDIALTRERETCYTVTHHDCTFTRGPCSVKYDTAPIRASNLPQRIPASCTLRRTLSESRSAPLPHLWGPDPPYLTRVWGQYHARALPRRRSRIFEARQPSPASSASMVSWCPHGLHSCHPHPRRARARLPPRTGCRTAETNFRAVPCARARRGVLASYGARAILGIVTYPNKFLSKNSIFTPTNVQKLDFYPNKCPKTRFLPQQMSKNSIFTPTNVQVCE